jgi:hypothetical protein
MSARPDQTMDVDQAIAIIQQLADGVDPATGERLPPSSVYQQADTVRALHLALEGLARLKRVKERVHSGPPNAGRPWTKDEEDKMLRQFDAKVDVAVIAQELNRTTGAIWARLEKVGRIQRKDFARPERVEGAGSTPYPPRTESRPIEEPSRDPGGKDDPLPF